jgi:glycosyltransferase involved in cell wall biosynthesis
MKNIVVVVPSYNNIKWCEKNVSSIVTQNYKNLKVVYTDDCSSDGTADKVENFLKSNNIDVDFELIKNKRRLGAMCNLYNMIHACNDDDVIITLDGDDWFAHENVCEKINSIYSNPDVWFTWGSYLNYPNNQRGCSAPIPRNVIDLNIYRHHPWCTSHLRTFYAKLFKKIKKEDFYDPSGKFLDVAWDLSFYIPFVEMGGHHGRYIHDVLYMYNNENPISDFRIALQRQGAMDRYIRSKPRYQRLESL